MQKSTEERANEMLVVFAATDPDDKVWQFSIKIADTATYLDPLSMLTNYFAYTLSISTFGGGLLELQQKSMSDETIGYSGSYTDNFHCNEGCVVIWCDDVNMTDDYTDSESDPNSESQGQRRLNQNEYAPTKAPTTKAHHEMCKVVDIPKFNEAQPFQVYQKNGIDHMYKDGKLEPGTYNCDTKVGTMLKVSNYHGQYKTCKEWAKELLKCENKTKLLIQ